MVRREQSQGFMLIEAVIAIVVFAIIAAVAFTGDVTQLRQVSTSFAELKAGRLASSRLEQLRDPNQVAALRRR